MNNFEKLFYKKKFVLGDIYLSENRTVSRAMKELDIYQKEGLDGVVIVETRKDCFFDIFEIFGELDKEDSNFVKGVSFVQDYSQNFYFSTLFNPNFIQFKDVSLFDNSFAYNSEFYKSLREDSNQFVIGGLTLSNASFSRIKNLELLCDAFCLASQDVSIEDLVHYKNIIKDFPLIMNFNSDLESAYSKLNLIEGGIFGKSFRKKKDPSRRLDKSLIRDFMSVVKEF